MFHPGNSRAQHYTCGFVRQPAVPEGAGFTSASISIRVTTPWKWKLVKTNHPQLSLLDEVSGGGDIYNHGVRRRPTHLWIRKQFVNNGRKIYCDTLCDFAIRKMDLIISTSNPRAKHKDFNLWLWFFAFKEMPSASSRITFLARHFQAEAADLPPARAVADGSMSSGPPDPAAQFPFLRGIFNTQSSRGSIWSQQNCAAFGVMPMGVGERDTLLPCSWRWC